MKKHYVLAALAMTALFTACSNEDEIPVEGREVRFSINKLVSTRAITTGNTTTFEDNDIITIYSTGLYVNDMNGEEYTVSGTTLTPISSNVYRFNGTKAANFYAYYPNTADKSVPGKVSVTIPADQSSPNAFQAYDLMTSVTSAANTTTVALSPFAHKLALIKVDASNIAQNYTINKVEVNGVKPIATWTYASDAVETSGDAITVQMEAKESSVYWAIIPAQQLSGNVISITATDKGGTKRMFNYTPGSAIDFQSGKINTLTLSLEGYQQVSATITTTAEWGNGVNENGNMTERQIELITASQGTLAEVPTLQTFSTDLPVGEWYTCGGITFEFVESMVKITRPSGGDAWHKSHLGFRIDPALIKSSFGKVFTISFSAKASEALKQFRVGVMNIEKTGSSYLHFKLSNNKGFQYITLGTDNQTYTIDVDFNYISRNDSGEANQGETFASETNVEDEDYNDVVLYFAPNVDAIDFYVNNITVKEKL